MVKAAAHFEASLLEWAQDCARRGRVKLVRPDWPVVAQVYDGTGFVVTVHYVSETDIVHGECTCAAEFDCKHVAATLLVALSRTADRAEADHSQRKQEAVGEWLSGMTLSADTPTSASPNSSRKLVAYVLSPVRGAVMLTIQQTTALRKGGFGRGQIMGALGDPARGVPSWVGVDDLRLISLARAVTRAEPQQTSLRTDRMDAALLRGLADSGRLFWRNIGDTVLRAGPDRDQELRWTPASSQTGEQANDYVIGLANELLLMPARETHYIDLHSGTIGKVDVGVAADIVQQLVHAPPVPRPMLATVIRSLAPVLGELATACLSRLDGEGLAKGDEDTMQPHLYVFVDDDPAAPCVTVRAEAVYGDARFDLADWDATRSTPRDMLAEGQRRRELDRLMNAHAGEKSRTALGDLRLARHVVQEVVPALQETGWLCKIDEEVPAEPVAVVDDWIQQVRPVANRPAWFELELGVIVAGQKVPLLPILLEAIREDRLPLASGLLEQEHVNGMNLRMPDGELVYVPGDRIKRWARPLVELQLRGVDNEDKLVVPAFTAPTLAPLTPTGPGEFSRAELLQDARARLERLIDLEPQQESAGFSGTLRPYQRQGLAWLSFLHDAGYGGILADDMGLGKTVQVIAFFESLRETGRLTADRPALVICPRSVTDHWLTETTRFAPGLSAVVHLGPARAKSRADLSPNSIVITSYQTMLRDKKMLASVPWSTVIFDESQNLKNPSSHVRKAAATLRGDSRFGITGTPVENNLRELWSQIDLTMPGLLGRQSTFEAVLRRPIEKHGATHMLEFLRQRIRPFMLRRTKRGVELDLPDKTEIIERINMGASQRDLYESLRLSLDGDVRKALNDRGVQGSSLVVLDALLKLRQCCCDPRLVKLPEAMKANSSAKLDRLMSMLEELADSGRFVLVFSQFTSMLELIEAECRAADIPYLKLTGATRKREKVIRSFQEGEAQVFLISLKAGGTGLNLTRADTIIHYDPWWNPAAEQQATDRAHRIGQTKNVFVYKLVARGTLEERIATLQDSKRALSDATLQDGGAAHLATNDLSALYHELV